LLKEYNYDALFVLIDNVDELPETDGNCNAYFTLLKSLAGTSSLMSLDGVYFKFFLPIDIKPSIEKFKAFRHKQVKPIIAEWPDYKLIQVLRQRLESATKDNRIPFTMLEGLSEAKDIDKKLINISNTPRDIAILGQAVFQEHITTYLKSNYITSQVLDLVLSFNRIKKSETIFSGNRSNTPFHNYRKTNIKMQKGYIHIKKDVASKNNVKIFINYAIEDYEMAHKISIDLNKSGIVTWFDKRDLFPGQKWEEEILNAIKKCSHFLPILSLKSVKKEGFVQKEINIALKRIDELPYSKIFIIPACLDKIKDLEDNPNVPDELRRLQWADLSEHYDDGLNKILRVVTMDS
jgi:hypothetical protein